MLKKEHLTLDSMEGSESAPKRKTLRIKKTEPSAVPTGDATAQVLQQKPSVKQTIKLAAQRLQTIDEWADFHRKSPSQYTFTPQGDLLSPDQTVIEMIPKVQAAPEIVEQRYQEKKTKIADAEAKFTEARRNLHEIMNQYRSGTATVGDVLVANQAAHVADCAISIAAKYPRTIIYPDCIYRDIHLNDFYNVRKVPDPILQAEYTSFPLQFFWSEKAQEKIALETLAEEETIDEAAKQAQQKKNAQIGSIIAANRARANAMAGRV